MARKHHVRTYKAWENMKTRCLNPKHKSYFRYGGSGIKICDEWLLYKNFLADMGEVPDGFSLDRIDGTKGYCKENCRWADIATQNQNRPNRKRGGKSMSKYRGVTKVFDLWYGYYCCGDGKMVYLHGEENEEDAAWGYDFAVLMLYGEHAVTNFKLEKLKGEINE